MKLRTVVADDESLARERMRRFIAEDPELEFTDECRNGKELAQLLSDREVDLVLLDIQMPGLNGLEVVKSINVRTLPMIVFVTAHHQYAPQAFDVHALDYLFKPVELLLRSECSLHLSPTFDTFDRFLKARINFALHSRFWNLLRMPRARAQHVSSFDWV